MSSTISRKAVRRPIYPPALVRKVASLAMIVMLLLAACAPAATPSPASQGTARPQVVVTTTLAGDVVRQVDTDSLTEPGGEADSYLAFMRYNVRAMVDALQ